MGHAKTKVAVSLFLKKKQIVLKNCLQKSMYQLKKGAHQTLSLHPVLSPLASLSLSNKSRIYWNVVIFAFQTQYIRGLFVRNNIDTSLLICTLYSIFVRESYVSPVILVLSVLW